MALQNMYRRGPVCAGFPPVPDFVDSILASVVAEVPGAGQRARIKEHAVVGDVPHAIAPRVASDTA
jgi:hypothetical protein